MTGGGTLRSTSAGGLMKTTKKKKMVPPGRSTEEVLGKQRKNLARLVDEMSYMEETRAVKVEKAPDAAARAKLEKRFSAERDADQRRINIVKDDFLKLQKNMKDGTVSENKIQQRRQQQIYDAKFPRKLDHEYNRFQGLETPVDFILHKATQGMFDKHADKFKKNLIRDQPAFDTPQEVKKLNLLNEKASVLRQVIAVQQREVTQAVHYIQENRAQISSYSLGSGKGIHQNDHNHKLHLGQLSQLKGGVGGGMSSARSNVSSASWASFASARAHGPTGHRNPSNVPKLMLNAKKR